MKSRLMVSLVAGVAIAVGLPAAHAGASGRMAGGYVASVAHLAPFDGSSQQSDVAELEGRVVSFDGTNLVIAHDGVTATVTISTSTEVTAGDSVPATLSAGEKVHVRATANADGTYTALRVVVEVNHGRERHKHGRFEHNSVQLEGRVVSFDSTHLVITHDGVTATVAISTSTEVTAGDGVPATLSAGEKVHVRAIVGAGNALTALRVVVESGHGHEQYSKGHGEHGRTHLEGRVVSFDGTHLVITHDGVTATVTISTSTEVTAGDGVPATLSAGEKVHVRATANADGTYTALRVVVESGDSNGGSQTQGQPSQEPIGLEGRVVSFDGTSLVITHDGGSATIAVASGIEVTAGDGVPATLSAGEKVHVRATANADGTYTALRVVVESGGSNGDSRGNGNTQPQSQPSQEPVELEGRVVSFDGTSLVISHDGNQTTVTVSGSASVTADGGASSTLAAGETVSVRAIANGDGAYTATSVVIKS